MARRGVEYPRYLAYWKTLHAAGSYGADTIFGHGRYLNRRPAHRVTHTYAVVTRPFLSDARYESMHRDVEFLWLG